MEMCRRCGPSIGYNSDVLNRIDVALAYLVGGNREYFRGGDFGNIQGVAQCVQDLSLSDCQDCLQEASGRLRSECETSTWGDMYLRKCYIRYADHGRHVICYGLLVHVLAATKAKKVAKSAKSEAASAKKKAQEVEDKADEALVKVQKAIENNEKINKPITFGPYGPRMPPCY
ncbi:hypothetical protein L1987_79306 [Smallanthus sonchifolius]|uniref:Uncharacterized protein n=1 Tax=Smallanthus sonchifolius TaxID=185202 RepID=A0ACB8ZG50_9ASTR|nr:hypothetical protein L1987_79306 [Smallanthus sonchifolius]